MPNVLRLRRAHVELTPSAAAGLTGRCDLAENHPLLERSHPKTAKQRERQPSGHADVSLPTLTAYETRAPHPTASPAQLTLGRARPRRDQGRGGEVSVSLPTRVQITITPHRAFSRLDWNWDGICEAPL